MTLHKKMLNRFLPFRREELLAVRQVSPYAAEWRVARSGGVQIFKLYFAIRSETTRPYQIVPG